MFAMIIGLIFAWYAAYLALRGRYERRHHKKLTFREFCNPKNWDRI